LATWSPLTCAWHSTANCKALVFPSMTRCIRANWSPGACWTWKACACSSIRGCCAWCCWSIWSARGPICCCPRICCWGF